MLDHTQGIRGVITANFDVSAPGQKTCRQIQGCGEYFPICRSMLLYHWFRSYYCFLLFSYHGIRSGIFSHDYTPIVICIDLHCLSTRISYVEIFSQDVAQSWKNCLLMMNVALEYFVIMGLDLEYLVKLEFFNYLFFQI